MTRKGIVTNWPLDGSRHIVSPKNARISKQEYSNGNVRWTYICRICGAQTVGFTKRSEAIQRYAEHEQKEHAGQVRA